MCESLCSDKEPARLLKEMVESGDLGAKTGKGFYDWNQRDLQALIMQRDRFLVEMLKFGV